jgi:molybdopterin-guanine dinucleotide biosynthesis protein A
MGSDKAFLLNEGKPFVLAIASELSRVSDDVLVLIGNKERHDFASLLNGRARVLNDDPYIDTPLGGLRSAFTNARHQAAAIVACDVPLLKAEVISYLFTALQNHSAAVPIRRKGDKMSIEPLCAIYNVAEGNRAIEQTIREGYTSPRSMILRMEDVQFVSVSKLTTVDPLLESFVNVNTQDEYLALVERQNTRPSNVILKGSDKA